MLSIFFLALLWLPSIIGLGVLLSKILFRSQLESQLFFSGILGIISCTFFGSFLNFFVPISANCSWIIWTIGFGVALVFARDIRASIRESNVPWLLGVLLLSSLGGQYGTNSGDMGLYHLQALKWAQEAPLPLGLANLHGRFGFNSSWFIFSAILGGYVGLANTLLSFFIGAKICGTICSLWKKQEVPTFSQAFLVICSVLWFKELGYGNVGSLTPDYPTDIFILSSVWVLIRILESSRKSKDSYADFILLALIASFAFTIKLSSLALLFFIPVAAFYTKSRTTGAAAQALYFLRSQRAVDASQKVSRTTGAAAQALRMLGIASICLAFVVIPWLLRGWMTSGCLFFPSGLGCFPNLPWAVPLRDVIRENDTVRAWARIPRVAPEVVLRDWRWLGPWFKEFLASNEIRQLLVILGTSLIAIIAGSRRLKSLIYKREFLIPFASCLFGIVLWFLSAPSIRFGRGYLFSAVFLMVVLALRLHGFRFNPPWVRVATIGFFVISIGLFVVRKTCGHDFTFFSLPAISKVPFQEKLTDQGMRVTTPLNGQSECWQAPLPCMAYFDPRLRITKGNRLLFCKQCVMVK